MSLEAIIADLDQTILKLQRIRNALVDEEEVPFPPEAEGKVANRVCLVCDKRIKSSDASRRGCHEKCYRRLKREMDKAGHLESDYVRAGKLAPKSFSTRPAILTVDLESARAVVAEARKCLEED